MHLHLGPAILLTSNKSGIVYRNCASYLFGIILEESPVLPGVHHSAVPIRSPKTVPGGSPLARIHQGKSTMSTPPTSLFDRIQSVFPMPEASKSILRYS